MTSSESLEAFEQQVRECLTRLYDFAFLQDHPLVLSLVPDQIGAQRVQTFRNLLLSAIETLRPGPNVLFHSRAARPYNILLLRHVEQQSAQDVARKLALSERQFYREHQKAVQGLAQMLWEQHSRSDRPEQPDTAEDISVQSEVSRAHELSVQPLAELAESLQGAIGAVGSLAEQHQVHLSLSEVPVFVLPGADRTTLRQAIIWVLSRLLNFSSPGGRIEVASAVGRRDGSITFTRIGERLDPEAIRASLEAEGTLRALMDVLGGDIEIDPVSASCFRLRLKLPFRVKTLLIVDDNPGSLDLFQRYLAKQPYQVLVARNGEEAVQVARAVQPFAIILDIMLPDQDGWEVLQNLRNHPTTNHIPVLICSVLDMPSLAFSLGASDFLRKPPGQAELLRVLNQWKD